MNINKTVMVPTAVGVVTGALGFAAGWFVHSRRYAEKIAAAADILDDEDYDVEEEEGETGNDTVVTIADIRAKREREREMETPGFVIPAEDYENIVKNPRRDPSTIVAGPPINSEPEVTVENIWDNAEESVPGWDWDAEKAMREEIPHTTPYILHRDEFFNEETHYGQTTLTYYAGDDKLTDEKDAPLYNKADIVGDCLQFGHGSGDPNTVYIRNNRLHAEYEVVLHEGKYDVEVLGLEAEKELESELRHSMDRPLKFRME